jgi:hypothetical protein
MTGVDFSTVTRSWLVRSNSTGAVEIFFKVTVGEWRRNVSVKGISLSKMRVFFSKLLDTTVDNLI